MKVEGLGFKGFRCRVQMTSNALAFPTFVDVDLQATIVLATESL